MYFISSSSKRAITYRIKALLIYLLLKLLKNIKKVYILYTFIGYQPVYYILIRDNNKEICIIHIYLLFATRYSSMLQILTFIAYKKCYHFFFPSLSFHKKLYTEDRVRLLRNLIRLLRHKGEGNFLLDLIL